MLVTYVKVVGVHGGRRYINAKVAIRDQEVYWQLFKLADPLRAFEADHNAVLPLLSGRTVKGLVDIDVINREMTGFYASPAVGIVQATT